MIDRHQIENLKVRFLKDNDMSFLYSSFLKSCKHAFKQMPADLYFAQMKVILLEILKTANVLVVHVNGEPDTIIGYCIYSRENGIFLLHYIYVKHVYRNLGIAKNLIISAGYDKDKEKGAVTLPVKHTDFSFFDKVSLVYDPLILYKGVEIMEENDE